MPNCKRSDRAALLSRYEAVCYLVIAEVQENVRDVGGMSEALFRLRPVAFEYARTLDPGGTAHYSLVAEEVSLVMPELVLRDKDGNPETVRYHLLVPPALERAPTATGHQRESGGGTKEAVGTDRSAGEPPAGGGEKARDVVT
jgi:hypothetical protein